MKLFSLLNEGESINSLLALRTYQLNGKLKASSFEVFLSSKRRYLLLRFKKERLLPFIHYGKLPERLKDD